MTAALEVAACPACHGGIAAHDDAVTCLNCGARYPMRNGAPVLVTRESELYPALVEATQEGVGAFLHDERSTGFHPRQHLKEWLKPEDRLWSRPALDAMRRLIATSDGVIVNIGAAEAEHHLKRELTGRDVLKVGFPTHGRVDIYGDALQLPLASDSISLVVSSSVFEHLSEPDLAAADTFRVVRPGGHVYAEIPFMRPFHMIPADYQRYTLSGIKRLFERHGFETVEVGVCSGPFTALALFAQDWLINPYSPIGWGIGAALVKRLLHPIKYLDRFVERSQWAAVCACNLYYAGRKP